MNTEKNGVTTISSPLLVWLLQNRYICVKRDRKTKKFEPGTRYAFRLSLVDTLTKKIPALSASTKVKNRKICGARIAHRRFGALGETRRRPCCARRSASPSFFLFGFFPYPFLPTCSRGSSSTPTRKKAPTTLSRERCFWRAWRDSNPRPTGS